MKFINLVFNAPILIGVLATSAANATVVVTNDSQLAPPATLLFTPTYTIASANDVLLGLAPTAQTGNFNIEFSGGTPILTDGAFGPMNNDGGPTATHPSLATFGNGGGAGSTLTYTLSSATVLSSIVIYSGWNDSGRDQSSYTVQGSTDGGTTYFNIGTANFNPTIPSGQQSALRVTFTDDAGNIAGGAALTNLKINANATENGYAGLAEITAYSAVPEASTAALGALGLLGLLRRRRA
jgi:hypothetical protein